ncbi:GIY-YIG nuclease family protein [uncultured Winogradskyella sp.]|uniref:GIY-YIG nuclease family protein n=1 Tax=uncultured Winogradskyella sp. TaxID=395353 RepID=UPI003514E649
MVYYVYILFSAKHKKSYVGMTNDLERRLLEHNSGYSPYTAKFGPWELLHAESFESGQDARQREKYLKSGAGRRWMKKTIKWPRSSAE